MFLLVLLIDTYSRDSPLNYSPADEHGNMDSQNPAGLVLGKMIEPTKGPRCGPTWILFPRGDIQWSPSR